MSKKALGFFFFSFEHVTGKNKIFIAPLYSKILGEIFVSSGTQSVARYFLSASSMLDFFLDSEGPAVNKRAGGSSSGSPSG